MTYHRQTAQDIMDDACLPTKLYENGVVRTMQEAIALALSQAYSRGLEDAIMELKAREKAHGQYANSIAAIRALGSK